jgi:hypothetical protein
MLFTKTTKKDGTIKYCNVETCDYKISLDEVPVEGETEKAETLQK